MKEVYSHSRLWLYENCPEYYKVKYIDRNCPTFPINDSLFLGGLVHDSLEWLYYQVKNREVTIHDFIENYTEKWSKKYSENIRFLKGDAKSKFNQGVKFLVDYYVKNKPFKDNTIEIEKRILFPLDNENKYFIQGYIDRLVFNDKNEYEIHDYKTNQIMKKKEELDSDRQLGFYHLGLKELFGKNIQVKLFWHFLAFNKKVGSERSQEQLDTLKNETLKLIKKIKETTYWPSCNKKWCDWCEYKRKNNLTYENFMKINS